MRRDRYVVQYTVCALVEVRRHGGRARQREQVAIVICVGVTPAGAASTFVSGGVSTPVVASVVAVDHPERLVGNAAQGVAAATLCRGRPASRRRRGC